MRHGFPGSVLARHGAKEIDEPRWDPSHRESRSASATELTPEGGNSEISDTAPIRCRLQKTGRAAPRREAGWAGACGGRIGEFFARREDFCIVGMTFAQMRPP